MKKPVTRKLNNTEKNKIIFILFFISLSLTQLALYISVAASKGYAMNSIVYNYYTDSYQEYFKPLSASMLNKPYSSYKIGEFSFYSPLYTLLFRFLSCFSNSELYEYDTNFYVYFSETTHIYMMFMAIVTAGLALLLYKYKKGNKPIKIWFLFLCLTSAPMIYVYERGNIILIALLFLLLFVFNYNSEEKYMRHLSLVFLALAVALKPYIILFVILLLREKRFKETLLELLYSVLLYIVPVFFTGGITAIKDMIDKIPDYINQMWDGGAAYRTDIFSSLDVVFAALGYKPLANDHPAKYVIWAILVISLIVCAFISKFQWKRILALTLLVTSAPFAESQSSLVFLYIPAIFCLDSTDEKKLMDMIHIFLMVVMMAPIAISDCIINLSGIEGNELYLHSFLVSISIMIAVIMLLLETLTMRFAGLELNDPKPPKEKKPKAKKEASEA